MFSSTQEIAGTSQIVYKDAHICAPALHSAGFTDEDKHEQSGHGTPGAVATLAKHSAAMEFPQGGLSDAGCAPQTLREDPMSKNSSTGAGVNAWGMKSSDGPCHQHLAKPSMSTNRVLFPVNVVEAVAGPCAQDAAPALSGSDPFNLQVSESELREFHASPSLDGMQHGACTALTFNLMDAVHCESCAWFKAVAPSRWL
jgi:hypothetical protein